MKRTLAAIMAALLAISFAACSDNTAEGESDSSAKSTVSVVSEAGESSAQDGTSENSEISNYDTNVYNVSELTVPDGAGPLLKSGLQEFIDKLGKDPYYFEYTLECLTEATDGKVESGKHVIVRDGDKISSTFTDNGTGTVNKQVVKDNKGYVVDDEAKTVTWAEVDKGLADNFTYSTAYAFYINTLELCGSGKETINGKEYDYEEYKEPASEDSTESSTEDSGQRARYYFDSGTLVGLKNILGDYYYLEMITELNQTVPDGAFDYPSEYELVESSEEESSAAESSVSESSGETAASAE